MDGKGSSVRGKLESSSVTKRQPPWSIRKDADECEDKTRSGRTHKHRALHQGALSLLGFSKKAFGDVSTFRNDKEVNAVKHSRWVLYDLR